MKKVSVFAVALVILGLLVGAASAAKDTLIVANQYDAKTLDPIATNDIATSTLCMHIYDNLIWQNDDGTIEPRLAESWEFLSDTEYKLNLRKGVKFHNGEELKADDVKFTLERAMSPLGAQISSYVEDIQSVEAPDDYTIIIKLKKPNTPFFSSLTHCYGSILNRKAVEAAGDNYGMQPVGTGPFKFDSWAKGDKVNLVRFDDFWGKKPPFEKLVFRSVVEPASRVIELESGAVDISYPIITNDIPRVKDNPKLALHRIVDNSITYMGFNTEKEPWSNPKVREAVSKALDTVGIQAAVWRGVGKAPIGPIPPNILYSDLTLPVHEQDVDAALAMLKEAGVKEGLKAQIWTNERKERIDMATIIQSQLAEVGIDAEIKVLEWGAYLDGLKKKEHDMFLLGWSTTIPDPDYALTGVLASNMRGATNYSYYSDKDTDDLLALGRQLKNGPEREETYKKVQKRIDSLAPWVYLHNDEQIAGAQKFVKGFTVSPKGYHSVRDVYFEE